MLAYESLRESLRKLQMTAAENALDNILESARTDELSVVATMDKLMQIESDARHERRVLANSRFAGLPYRRTLEDFDFTAQPSIDKELIERLGTLRFISEGTNVILLGPPGVGKTHLAVGLLLRALESGNRVFFISISTMIRKHSDYIRKGLPSRMLTNLIKPVVLVLDEIGYTPLDQEAARLLFDVIDIRYRKKKPIILTSNKSWGQWGEIIPDRVMATAILDRLLHYSITINITGDSYRLREHREFGLVYNNKLREEESNGRSVAFKPAKL